ncbi:MAG TPA: DEAD/DEAH box helicase, partial [Nocardioides sp.]|nr:DEAD/DEAH box helicase [Nocardioides sp.]
GQPAWRVIPLTRDDIRVVHRLADRAKLPELSLREKELLDELVGHGSRALEHVKYVATWRRIFVGKEKEEQGSAALRYLRELHERCTKRRLDGLLERIAAQPDWLDPARLTLDDVLDPRLDLEHDLEDLGGPPKLLDDSRFGELQRAMTELDEARAEEEGPRQVALEAVAELNAGEVTKRLKKTSVRRLRDVTDATMKISALEMADIETVQDALSRRNELEHINGIGAATAASIVEAAEEVRRITEADVPLRIDTGERTPELTGVVRAVAEWDAVRRTKGAREDLALADDLRPLAAALSDDVVRAVVLPTRALPASALADGIDVVIRRADLIAEHPVVEVRGQHPVVEVRGAPAASLETTQRGTPIDPWQDFLRRPADYYAMLADLGVLTEDEERGHGDLPPGLVESVREQVLRTEHLRVTLRGYQSFGARFALVQRKVIIGDEMGLGKTIEALAVMAHLWSTGAQHFLIVCPPGVVTNWIREIESKSTLDAHRIHGDGWRDHARRWEDRGGVAVTTYDTSWWESEHYARRPRLGCVVVDEAHYVKNPETQRARRTAALLATVDRAVLLTGTPMENHVGEFCTLISYLRPDLLAGRAAGEERAGVSRPSPATELAPRRFRAQVAPVYLRRNQEDVLTELPDLVEVEEWLPMGELDLITYKVGVTTGNLMQMRQAAMSHGTDSPKVQRLLEIVEEAEDNGRKVIVYSFFKAVLADLAQLVPGPVFGPLDGSVAASARQMMVDDFTAAEEGAVLLAQVTTGGTGLNIQAASVVIICEPQLTPTKEAQAIARAHRMGQLDSVQVHRLLSEDSVDERIREILEDKRHLFDEFVRESSVAHAAPEATQVAELTEAEIGRRVLDAERARLLYEPPAVVAPDN